MRFQINYLLSFSEVNTFYKGMTTWTGAKEVFIESVRPKRKKGRSSWGFWTKFNFAIDGIFSFSWLGLARRLFKFL